MPALKLAATGNVALDVLAAMTRVNALIEDWIRARPEQWLWLHRRVDRLLRERERDIESERINVGYERPPGC
jgi:lauroyl/myristoyl acyltransferase